MPTQPSCHGTQAGLAAEQQMFMLTSSIDPRSWPGPPESGLNSGLSLANCYELLTENGKGEALGALGGDVTQVWLKASSLHDSDSILLCLHGL